MLMVVTFDGVRGSIPCAERRFMRYGGNTSCIHVQAGDTEILLDAGTGLRQAGVRLRARGVSTFHLLLSHTHWDHVCGLPFFGPSYDPACDVTVMAGRHEGSTTLRETLGVHLAPPVFPVDLASMPGIKRVRDIEPSGVFALASDVRVITRPLRHPGGATGYRIEHGGASVCYVTDTEHELGVRDPRILELIAGSDLLIYDATYTDAEMPARTGWGHSSWEEGVRLCQASGTRALAVHHHDPDRDDRSLDRIARDARKAWKGAFVAREGQSLTL